MVKLSPEQIAGIVQYESTGMGSSFAYTARGDIDKDGPIFVAIAMAESNGETTATHKNTNGTTDFGLWQINSVHKELLARNQPWSDPRNNYHMALELYNNRGGKFLDWTTFKTGLYSPYLPAAQHGWNNPDSTATDPNAVHDAVNNAHDTVVNTADFLGTLTRASTWIRIGMGAAGVLLLIIALAPMLKHIPLPGPVGVAVKTAQTVKAVTPVVKEVA